MERLVKINRITPRNAIENGFSRLGIGFEKLDRGAFDPNKAYDLVAELGIHYVRIQSGWQRTETEKGKYDFSWLDSIVDELRKRGMEPWINLCYGNQLYTESAKTVFGAVGCAPIFTEEEREGWRKYCSALAKHFKDRVVWYEIWNEPDGKSCWRHGANATEYGNFVIESADAIRQGDSNAKIIAGALCNIKLPFFKQMFDCGIGNVIDAVSFHRYSVSEINAQKEIQALRALIDKYNPEVGIIQGESGSQSDSRGAGALRGGAWSPIKQAKHLLRQRIVDLSSEVLFTSHFSSMDMAEALNGIVGDKLSYKDYGYFGLIQADFDEDGVATGNYRPKLAYQAMQNLSAVFTNDVIPADIPLKTIINESPRVFGKDESGCDIIVCGFQKGTAWAAAYWKAANILQNTFEGTISFQLAGEPEPPVLIDLLHGSIYKIPDSMIKYQGADIVEISNLPLTDWPLLLGFSGF